MIKLIIAGATGQTGTAVARLAEASGDLDLMVGIGRVVSMGGAGLPTVRHVKDAPAADVVIDFTTPETAVTVARDCADRGIALVTGTTGLTADQQQLIKEAAAQVPVVQSGNFSLGVNVLWALVEKASAILDHFDIEIIESHHRRKIDAPSGTALMLGEAAARGRGSSLASQAVFARHGQTGPRPEGEIGFSVVRGGGVVGDHDVSFLAESEVVTLSHRAIDRGLFAQGALAAAKWVAGRTPGLYSMRDVLGL